MRSLGDRLAMVPNIEKLTSELPDGEPDATEVDPIKAVLDDCVKQKKSNHGLRNTANKKTAGR